MSKIVLDIVGRITSRPLTPNEVVSSLGSLGIGSSIRLIRLRSALEQKAQKKIGQLNSQMTVSDLIRLVETVSPVHEDHHLSNNERKEAAEILAPRATDDCGVVGVGIDIESISELPDTNDYRSDSFYSRIFRTEEISYALLKSDPKQTLAGIFSLKEAFRKAHASFLDCDMKQIAVRYDGGRPVIALAADYPEDREKMHLFSSISHTETTVVAVVVVTRSSDIPKSRS